MTQATKYSTFLFALPKFPESIGRPLDLAGATNELNLLGEATDRLALAADWAALGEDFRNALGDVTAGTEGKETLGALLLLLASLVLAAKESANERTRKA
ncbi:MAG: hypothetical protein ABDH20_05650 [Thermus sp.]